MVELSTVARPYAEAAFLVAKTGNVAQWSDWLDSWSTLSQNLEIQELIQNPKFFAQEVLDLFVQLSKTQADVQAVNFLQMLVENGRLLALSEIARQFAELKNALEGLSEAEIISAFPMSDSDVQQVAASLEKKFGTKLKITVQVDPSLIGGVCVKVGDQVLDNSVRGKLDAMKVALTV